MVPALNAIFLVISGGEKADIRVLCHSLGGDDLIFWAIDLFYFWADIGGMRFAVKISCSSATLRFKASNRLSRAAMLVGSLLTPALLSAIA